MAEPVTKEQPRALAPIETVKRELHLRRKALEAVLPKHLTPERLCRLALTACEKTPKLLECDRPSLYGAILTAAQLGLEPDGILGQAYLVPFKGKVQFIPGYKGLIALARQSGEVQSIFAGAVREGDSFAYRFGLNDQLDHIPSMDADRAKRPITHFYAIAKFRDGGHHFDVLPRAEVEAIRDNTAAMKANHETPWKSHFEEMGKKTAIRRIAKYLPMNVQKAAVLVDAYDTGRHAQLNERGEVVLEVESRRVESEEKPAGNFLDRFEQEPAIEAQKVDEPTVVEPEPTPADIPEPASVADLDALRERARKRGMGDDQLNDECLKVTGKVLAELTHGECNTMTIALAKKK